MCHRLKGAFIKGTYGLGRVLKLPPLVAQGLLGWSGHWLIKCLQFPQKCKDPAQPVEFLLGDTGSAELHWFLEAGVLGLVNRQATSGEAAAVRGKSGQVWCCSSVFWSVTRETEFGPRNRQDTEMAKQKFFMSKQIQSNNGEQGWMQKAWMKAWGSDNVSLCNWMLKYWETLVKYSYPNASLC